MSRHSGRPKRKDTPKKPKSKERSASEDGKSSTSKSEPSPPGPEPEPWSAWDWSAEGSFYWRARKSPSSEWEYETCAPSIALSPIKDSQMPRTIPNYRESPQVEYLKASIEVEYVESREPVYEKTEAGPGLGKGVGKENGSGKGEYTWEKQGTSKVEKVGGNEENRNKEGEARERAKAEQVKEGDGKEGQNRESKEDKSMNEEKKVEKDDAKKIHKKANVDERRKGINEPSPIGQSSDAEDEMTESPSEKRSKEPKERKKDKSRHPENGEYERTHWRRREKRK